MSSERRRVVAEALLALRLRRLVRINDELYADTSHITHAEYQLFLDEWRAMGAYFQPDYWHGFMFPKGQGRLPVVGVRSADAVAFCDWLSQHDATAIGGGWHYRLPKSGELAGYGLLTTELAGDVRGHWLHTGADAEFERLGPLPGLSNSAIIQRLENDLARDCDRALARALYLAHARGRDLARDRDLNRGQEDLFKFLRWYVRILAVVIIRMFLRELVTKQRGRRPWSSWGNKKIPYLQSLLEAWCDFYIDMVTLEERIEGKLPAFEGIWIIKEQVKE